MKKAGNLLIGLGVLFFLYVGGEHLYSKKLEERLLKDASLSYSRFSSEEANKKSAQPKQESVILSIPNIDLNVPVLEGTEPDILRVAVGHLEGTGDLGVKGENAVFLGHRSFITGQFFSRLDELKQGDTFLFQVGEERFTYQVTKSDIIQPNDWSVLEPAPEESRVTLITCHPRYSSKQRLVVTAVLKP